MREAIANAGVFNLVIVFVIILLAFFIGSLGYSKAFKVKNKIVDEIEKDHGYLPTTQDSIEKWLGTIGYRLKSTIGAGNCGTETFNGKTGELVSSGSNYQYCVYKFNSCGNTNVKKCSTHYRVVSYMYFDVPVINSLIKIPVKGETVSFSEINS